MQLACFEISDASGVIQRTPNPLALEAYRGSDISPLALLEYQRAKTVLDSHATDSNIVVPHPPDRNFLPYQRAGIAYAAAHLLTLIGDEPGTGKTIQAIGLSNYLPEIRRILIVSPAALKLNWSREWRGWDTKELSIGIVNGTKDVFPMTDVVIINYEILKTYRWPLRRINWDLMIVDEAHRLKNKKTNRTREVLGGIQRNAKKEIIDRCSAIPADRKLFLTGTPSLNGKPKELWPLLQALDPSGLGLDWYNYAKRYCQLQEIMQYSFETHKNERVGWIWDGADNLGELQQIMRSRFLVRRLKCDVLKDLPEKDRRVVVIEPGRMKKKIQKELETFEAYAKNNPDAYDKMPAFEGFSQMLHETGLALVKPAIEIIEDDMEERDKIVVMAYHKDVAGKIFEHFKDRALLVTGDIAPEKRVPIVDRFQKEPIFKVLVCTQDSASEGLTMTAASLMIFVERSWQRGGIIQAEDRIHRIGQKSRAVYKHLVLADSLGERQIRSFVAKQNNSEKMLDKPKEI
jgi:SWI/SNF-related matrix-associated actin-dependent regulator 1 of chromatin subfamily A